MIATVVGAAAGLSYPLETLDVNTYLLDSHCQPLKCSAVLLMQNMRYRDVK